MGNILEYNNGLGYTGWAEINCSEMVKRGRAAVRKANDYNKRRYNLQKRFDAMQAKGNPQKDLELMEDKYRNLTVKKLEYTGTLQREKTLTAAWKRSPELYYQEYIATKGMGWGWLKRMVGGVSKVVTGGASCNGRTKSELNSDLAKASRAESEYRALESKINTLKNVEQKSKDYLTKNLQPLMKEVKQLETAIANERKTRQQIMVTYEAKKRAKALALEEQARQEKLKRAKLTKAQATAKEATKEAVKKAEDNKGLIIAGIAAAGLIMAMKKKRAAKH